MVDVLGGNNLIVAIIFLVSILGAFRLRSDWTGITIGLAFAALATYLARNMIWSLAQGVFPI